MGSPLNILKSSFLHAWEDQKQAQSEIFMNLGPQMTKIRMDNQKEVKF